MHLLIFWKYYFYSFVTDLFVSVFVFVFFFFCDLCVRYTFIIYDIHIINIMCSCGSVVEHYVSSTKVVGLIPREHTYWQKKCFG